MAGSRIELTAEDQADIFLLVGRLDELDVRNAQSKEYADFKQALRELANGSEKYMEVRNRLDEIKGTIANDDPRKQVLNTLTTQLQGINARAIGAPPPPPVVDATTFTNAERNGFQQALSAAASNQDSIETVKAFLTSLTEATPMLDLTRHHFAPDKYQHLFNQRDENGNTLLHYLIANAADDKKYQQTLPLIVGLVKNFGADPTIRNNAGQSVLDLAKERSRAARNVVQDIVGAARARAGGLPDDHDRVDMFNKVQAAVVVLGVAVTPAAPVPPVATVLPVEPDVNNTVAPAIAAKPAIEILSIEAITSINTPETRADLAEFKQLLEKTDPSKVSTTIKAVFRDLKEMVLGKEDTTAKEFRASFNKIAVLADTSYVMPEAKPLIAQAQYLMAKAHKHYNSQEYENYSNKAIENGSTKAMLDRALLEATGAPSDRKKAAELLSDIIKTQPEPGSKEDKTRAKAITFVLSHRKFFKEQTAVLNAPMAQVKIEKQIETANKPSLIERAKNIFRSK